MTDTSSCASYAPENRALSAAEARDRMLAEVTPITGREFVAPGFHGRDPVAGWCRAI